MRNFMYAASYKYRVQVNRGGVEPAEDDVAADRAQQGEPVLVQRHEGVALGAVLVGGGLLGALDLVQALLELRDELVDAEVEAVGVGLLRRRAYLLLH